MSMLKHVTIGRVFVIACIIEKYGFREVLADTRGGLRGILWPGILCGHVLGFRERSLTHQGTGIAEGHGIGNCWSEDSGG